MTLDPSILILGIFTLLFLLAAFLWPLIFLIHSISSSEISGGNRAAWGLSMIFVWPIPNYAYAFASSNSRNLKMLAGFGLASMLGFVVSLAYVVVNVLGMHSLADLKQIGAGQKPSQLINRLRLAPLEQVDVLSRRLEKADLRQLTQAQRDAVQLQLGQLQMQLQDENLDENSRKALQHAINQLSQSLDDKTLTAPEAQEFMQNIK